MTYLCCSSSSTDLRRLLFVRQVKRSIDERENMTEMNEKKNSEFLHWDWKSTRFLVHARLQRTFCSPDLNLSFLLTKHSWKQRPHTNTQLTEHPQATIMNKSSNLQHENSHSYLTFWLSLLARNLPQGCGLTVRMWEKLKHRRDEEMKM